MTLRERMERLEDRERRLLFIMLAIAAAAVVMLPPLAVSAMVHSRESDVEAVREVLTAIADEKETLDRVKSEKSAILQRYARPAPPLAAFLAGLASQSSLEILESQDRQAVPHGKKFEERTTKITLRKVGMLNLVKFLERIEQSGHPLRVSQFNLRKRGTEPDSYDVDMVVSAFDRKAEPKSDKAQAAPSASAPGAGTDDAPGADDEEDEE
jgi:general secretion pathway protein M